MCVVVGLADGIVFHKCFPLPETDTFYKRKIRLCLGLFHSTLLMMQNLRSKSKALATFFTFCSVFDLAFPRLKILVDFNSSLALSVDNMIIRLAIDNVVNAQIT